MNSRIPEQCATCPWLQLEQKYLDEHELEQDSIIRRATSDEIDEVAEFIATKLRQAPQEFVEAYGTTSPDAETVAKAMRAMGSEALGIVSRHMEKIGHDMEMMSNWCKGPVEMSTTRDGIVYSSRVCASLVLLDEDTRGVEPVTVRREELLD